MDISGIIYQIPMNTTLFFFVSEKLYWKEPSECKHMHEQKILYNKGHIQSL
jgi:hypothetical protein